MLQTPRAERIAARALHPAERLHAPHLIDIEVAQVMRRLVQAKEITVARADAALVDFEGLVIELSYSLYSFSLHCERGEPLPICISG